MKRRSIRILAIVVLSVVLLAGAAALWRKELAGWLIASVVSDLGLEDPRFEVVEVTLDRLKLAGVRAGPAGEVAARRLVVDFSPWRAVRGELDEVEVEGLHLVLNLTGEGPPLPGLDLGSGGSGASGPLPRIVLRDATVEAATVLGAVETRLDGAFGPAGAGRSEGSFAMSAQGELGRLGGKLVLGLGPDGRLGGQADLDRGALSLPGGTVEGVTGLVSFQMGGGQEPVLHLALDLSGVDLPGAAFRGGHLDAALEAGRVQLSGRLEAAEPGAEAEFALAAEELFGRPRLDGKAVLRLPAGTPLWSLFGLPVPDAGTLSLEAALAGTLASFDELGGGPFRILRSSSLTGRVTLDLQDLVLAGHVSGLAGHVALDWDSSAGLSSLGVAETAVLTAAALDAAWLAGLGLPQDTALGLALQPRIEISPQTALLGQPEDEGRRLDARLGATVSSAAGLRVALDLDALLQRATRGAPRELSVNDLTLEVADLPLGGPRIASLRLTSDDLAGPFDALAGSVLLDALLAELPLSGATVQGLRLGGRIAVAPAAEAVELRLLEPGSLSLQQVLLEGKPALSQPVQSALPAATLALDWSRGLQVVHDVTLTLGRQSLVAGGISVMGDFGELQLAGRSAPEGGYGLEARLRGATLELPDYRATLSGLDADYRLPLPGETATPGSFALREAAVQTESGRVAGLSLAGTVEQQGSLLRVSGQGKGPGGQGKLAIALTHDTAKGEGSVQADWGPVTFKPGGLQPVQLLPDLKDFKQVSGGLRAVFKAAWGKRSSQQLDLTLENVGFEHPQATVEGLSAKPRLTSLDPPVVAPTKVTARRIDAGAELTELATTLSVEAARAPVIVLTDTVFRLLGGRFSTAKVRWDERAASVPVDLEVSDLDLAQVSTLLALPDLVLEGRMSGRLPLAYQPGDEGIVVTGGRLAATGPGAIRYGQAGTASLRAGGDERFALALQALENFRYKQFEITLDKAASGKTKLGILLVGANPAVLDGYPFHLNIAIDTDLSQVLSALREGYRLNPDLFKGGWTFR